MEADDYRQVLDPAAADAMKAHDKVRLLYVFGEQYEGYTAAAMWEDTKLGFHDISAWDELPWSPTTTPSAKRSRSSAG